MFMAKVIGIYNQEKNTGKTVTAAYLSESLANLGLNVLCIDIDYKNDLTCYLSQEDNDNDLKDIDSLIRATLKIKKFQNTWDFLSLGKSKISKKIDFKSYLSQLFKNYNFVIIDFPSGESSNSDLFLRIVDSIIIPVECEYYGLDELNKTLIKIIELGDVLIEGILLTKFDIHNLIIQNLIDKIKLNFSEIMLNTIISRNYYLASTIFLEESSNQTLTHVGFSNYLKLANELKEKLENG